jgi:formylglycine-generating enzyme
MKPHFKMFAVAFCLVAVNTLAQVASVTNKLGMEFVLVNPGHFTVGKFEPPFPTPQDTIKNVPHKLVLWMGDGRSYNSEEFAKAKELALKDYSPGFNVHIDKAFYIGRFEITQKQWKEVMKNNPSQFQGESIPNADNHPVENVTWDDVQLFIKKLNAIEKGKKYRLPTEFEWEYAARAGEPEKDIAWKDTQQMAQLGTMTTQVVGGKKPNAWGLYDMLGNVWEWVNDIYNEKIFADPKPPKKGKQHVLKGASFAGDVKNATYMTHAAGPGNGWDVGFRLVLMVDEK